MLKNEKGFTLIEIIAVLVILGILAAVAIPKYIGVQEEARTSAAQEALAEVRARANQYYAIQTLRSGLPAAPAAVLASVTATPNLGDDFTVAAAADATGSNILITVSKVKNHSLTTPVVGTWYYPQQ